MMVSINLPKSSDIYLFVHASGCVCRKDFWGILYVHIKQFVIQMLIDRSDSFDKIIGPIKRILTDIIEVSRGVLRSFFCWDNVNLMLDWFPRGFI